MNTTDRLKELEAAEMRNALPKLLAVVEASEALSKRLYASLDGEMDAWLKEILFDLNDVLRDALAALEGRPLDEN